MQRIEFISQLPLFSGLTDAELEALSRSATDRSLGAGTEFAGETDEVPELLLIREGRLKFTKISETGKEQTIQMFGPGDLVGLFTLFTGFPFPASVVVMENTVALSFSRTALEKAAQRIPTLMVNLFYALAVRMNHCMCTVSILTLNEISQRVARYLLAEAKGQAGLRTVSLAYSHREWALIMGTTPETLSRVLTRFSAERLISQSGRVIAILDEERLAET